MIVAGPGIRTASASTLAAVGAGIWALQTYVFHGNVPYPISAAMYTCIPSAVGFIYTHIALNRIPPSMVSNIRAQLKNGPIKVLPPDPVITKIDPPQPPTGGQAA